jgi:hypothetical protein
MISKFNDISFNLYISNIISFHCIKFFNQINLTPRIIIKKVKNHFDNLILDPSPITYVTNICFGHMISLYCNICQDLSNRFNRAQFKEGDETPYNFQLSKWECICNFHVELFGTFLHLWVLFQSFDWFDSNWETFNFFSSHEKKIITHSRNWLCAQIRVTKMIFPK